MTCFLMGCDFFDPGITPKKVEVTAAVSTPDLGAQILAMDFLIDDRLSGDSRLLVISRNRLLAIDPFGGVVAEKQHDTAIGALLTGYNFQGTAMPLALSWSVEGEFSAWVYNANDEEWLPAPVSGTTPPAAKSVCAKLDEDRLEVFDHKGGRLELLVKDDRFDGLNFHLVPTARYSGDGSCDGVGWQLIWDEKRILTPAINSPAVKLVHQDRPDDAEAFILIQDGLGTRGISRPELLALTHYSLGGVGFKDGVLAAAENGRIVMVAKSNLDTALERKGILRLQ